MSRVLRVGAALACALLFGMSAPLAQGSEAQTSEPAGPSGVTPTNPTSYRPSSAEFSLTISPTRLVVGPGQLDDVSEFLVVNRGSSAAAVTVQKRDFTGGSDGELLFAENAPYSASTWVTVEPTTFVVQPGAAQVVTAAVAVATDPEPGDHQVAIVFLVPAGETGDNVRINRGVAAPVYVTVPGPTDDSTSLDDLRAPGFVTGGPVTIAATVNDTGTVHRDFRGANRLVVRAGGGTADFPDFTVLRGSTRDISTQWDPPLLCVCHPTVSITAADGTVRTVAVRVIVFPLRQVAVAIGIGIALYVGVVLWRRRYRANVLRAAAAIHHPTGSHHALDR